MSDPVRRREWQHYGLLRRTLALGETWPGDDVTEVMVRGQADGITVLLTPDQLDELAADLAARAALMRGAR